MTEGHTSTPNDTAVPTNFEDSPEIRAKVVTQVEYYFSDYNLSRDTFLRDLIKANPEGWVPIDTLLKFNRLRSMCSQPDKIIDILRESEGDTPVSSANGPYIKVDAEARNVRRNLDLYPLPPDFATYLQQLESHSVYAKGFPKNSTLEEVRAFLVANFGPVLTVYMRNYPVSQGKKTAGPDAVKNGPTRLFKGSVFVTFKEGADAEKFLQAPSVKYKGQELVSRMAKHVYETQKKVEYEERQSKNKKKGVKEPATEEEKATMANRVQQLIQKGNVLHLKGFQTSDHEKSTTSRHTLKEAFDNHGKVAWIDFEPGQPEAHVRFTGGNEVAQDVLTKMAAKLEFGSTGQKVENDGKEGENTTEDTWWTLELPGQAEIKARILRGEEELKYWMDVVEHITKAGAGQNNRQGKRKNNKQNRAGGFSRKNSNKRKRDQDNACESANTKSLKT